MDLNKWGLAAVIAALVEAANKLKEAQRAAFQAKDEAQRAAFQAKDEVLCHKLYQKETELMDMAADLIKDEP